MSSLSIGPIASASRRARSRLGWPRARRFRLHPRCRLCSATRVAQSTVHFFTDPKVGMIQTRWGHINRGYSLLTRVQAMFLDGHLLLEQVARSRSGRFFNFNGTAGLWRKSCIERLGRLATRHADRRSRSQLSRAARRLEVCLPHRCRDAGGIARRHEWLQITAASLDQRLDPDLQEIAAAHLAERVCRCRSRSKRPAISLQISPTSCSPVFASSCIPRPAARNPAGCACSCSTFRFSSPLRSPSRSSIFARSANCIRAPG